MSKTLLPRVEVSAHSIDRLSQRCLHIWLEQGKEEGIGLMTFFITKSREAYSVLLNSLSGNAIDVTACKISYEGVTYIFSTEHGVTKLVTAYLSS